MTFDGALIREQGVTFAVVVVKQHVIQNRFEAQRAIAAFGAQAFPGVPVVLMAQDGRGTPTYYGRTDLVQYMASVPPSAVPWMRYTLS